jgi:oligoribonuclease
MAQETKHDRLVWLDLETTGLDESTDLILECGVKVTTPELEVIQEASWLVIDPGWHVKLTQNTFCLEMHEKSGLVSELRSAERLFVDNLDSSSTEESIVSTLTQDWGLNAGVYPMFGNTIGFDRKFLRKWMPGVESFFHYRSVDNSTVKELIKFLNPELYLAMKREDWAQEDKKTHRALDDLRFSVAELQFYIDNFLFVENFTEDLLGM